MDPYTAFGKAAFSPSGLRDFILGIHIGLFGFHHFNLAKISNNTLSYEHASSTHHWDPIGLNAAPSLWPYGFTAVILLCPCFTEPTCYESWKNHNQRLLSWKENRRYQPHSETMKYESHNCMGPIICKWSLLELLMYVLE